ncbi:uncharacterized protein LOC127096240 [Lathyrus oleraceus]|uniref:uncharacterized protein LOC127096240 n=1 Tax=Pisum sativum TaxID=3888 RepID=UPI0021CDEC77|nr:uncharacterized protein LOC127096240 [Pisum sativum]
MQLLQQMQLKHKGTRIREMRKKDQKALFYIHQCVDMNGFKKIPDSTTVKVTWDTLVQCYGDDASVKKVKLQSLRKKYENINMKNKQKVPDYISRVILITNGMKSYGETISEQVIIEKLFTFSEKSSSVFSAMAPQKPSSSKHSKKRQDSSFPPVHDLKGPMTIGNQQYVPEPPNEKEKDCIYKSQASRKPSTIQKKKSEEERQEDKVPSEESGDESPELIPPPQKKKKLTKVSSQRSIANPIRKDPASASPAKPQSKDMGSGKSSFNTEIPEEQVVVAKTPEKILEETAPEEDVPPSDHDMQTVEEFDTTVGDASEDESPPHPGLHVAPQGDDIEMEVVVEDDPEDGASRDGDNQSKRTEVEHTSTRNTPPTPDRVQGSSKSTDSEKEYDSEGDSGSEDESESDGDFDAKEESEGESNSEGNFDFNPDFDDDPDSGGNHASEGGQNSKVSPASDIVPASKEYFEQVHRPQRNRQIPRRFAEFDILQDSEIDSK